MNYRVLLSEVLQQQGQMDEALSVALESLRLYPNSAQTNVDLGNLAAHGHYVLTDADIRRMQQLLSQGRQSAADACLLNFALAGHWERSSKYDESFACYRRANELKLQAYRNEHKAFDQEKHRAMIDGLIAVFTPEYLAKTRTFGIDTEMPVFVVGLVRSGTTARWKQIHGPVIRRST